MVMKIFDRIAPKRGFEKESENFDLDKPTKFGDPNDNYKMKLVWRNIFLLTYIHVAGLYAIFSSYHYTWQSHLFVIFCTIFSAFGTTVGAHRLYTHRSFKANLPLRVLLLFLQTFSVQNSMYEWVRDHRVHHKYTDTNADPHNSRRGFFFSHVGWLMCKKHPEVTKFGAKVDMSDLENDKLVMFQHKYYAILAVMIGFVLPIRIAGIWEPNYMQLWYGHLFKYCVSLNLTWSINSAAHCFGSKPFDKNISSTDSWLVGTFVVGEGWHNYHHVFPWDYKTSELPHYGKNVSMMFIDFMAKIGWATDLKTVSQEMINRRALRTGDGSHESSFSKPAADLDDLKNNNTGDTSKFDVLDHSEIWGWDDKEMKQEDKKLAKILYSTSL